MVWSDNGVIFKKFEKIIMYMYEKLDGWQFYREIVNYRVKVFLNIWFFSILKFYKWFFLNDGYIFLLVNVDNLV